MTHQQNVYKGTPCRRGMDEITEKDIENVREMYTKKELAYLYLTFQREWFKKQKQLEYVDMQNILLRKL